MSGEQKSIMKKSEEGKKEDKRARVCVRVSVVYKQELWFFLKFFSSKSQYSFSTVSTRHKTDYAATVNAQPSLLRCDDRTLSAT